MKTVVSFLLVACSIAALAAGKGQAEFLEGLDLMENAKYTDATASFSKALEEDEENVTFYIARGVSYLLAENLKPAMADFDRALRLDQANKHAKLWKSVLTNMQGNFMGGSLIYPQATHDQYENQCQDMARLYGEWNFRKTQNEPEGEWTKKWRADHETAKKKFSEIARLFSNRVKGTTGDIAQLMVDRAEKKIAAKEYASALKDLQQAAATNPKDLNIVFHRGVCNLNLASPAAARAQFVRVLTYQSNHAEAWNGHALACVDLGDIARAKASSENAAALNPQRAGAYREALEARLKTAPQTVAKKEDLAGMVTDLYKLASGKGNGDELVKQAMGIIQSTNAHRLRADETYLDRRLRLEAIATANPQSAKALADLGEFLYTQALSVRGEAVEPLGAKFTSYRPQTDETQQQELTYAMQSLDRALAIDPNNVQALTFKAAVLMHYAKWGDAETILKRALDIDPTYGPLLQTFAKVMDHAAGVKAVAASNLRSTKSWEDSTYIYYRYPSQAELALAAEYERQAQALWALAERHLEAAAKNYAGKPLGYYYSGILAKRRGQGAEARAAFEECVKLQPDFAQAWDQLTELYHMLGLKAENAFARSAASNLFHTTSGHLLRHTWGDIVRTKYKTAREALQKSMAIDPADARNCAYMAVVAAGNGNQPVALAWWRCAAALEEAHATLAGTSFRAEATETTYASQAARVMAINLRLGQIALEQNRADAAAGAFQTNIIIGNRVPKLDRFYPVVNSMLPDKQTDFTIIPEAETVLSMICWSHLGLGQALLAQGKEKEAFEQFAIVRQLPSQVPPTLPKGNMMGDPAVLATIHTLKPLMARKEWAKAQQVARSHGHVGMVTKEYGDELRTLSRAIDEAMAQARYSEHDKEVEEARKQQQAEIDKEMKEREDFDRKRSEEADRIRKEQQEIDRRRRQGQPR